MQFHLLAECSAQHLFHAEHDLIYVARLRIEGLPSYERQADDVLELPRAAPHSGQLQYSARFR